MLIICDLLLALLWLFLLSVTLFSVSWREAMTKHGECRSIFLSILKIFSKIFRVMNRSDVEQLPEEKVFEISSSELQWRIGMTASLMSGFSRAGQGKETKQCGLMGSQIR
jgi:hypothetical protein